MTRQLLRYAAVLGGSFSTIVFDRLLEPEGIHLDQATWTDLRRFIEPQGTDRLRFILSVVHSAAYHGLSYRRRKELHARAGAVIEELAGNDADSSADVLSYHFSNSGDHGKAWKYSRTAAERAKKTYANEQAVAHYQAAIGAANNLPDLDRAEVVVQILKLGDILRIQGDSTTARNWYTKALRTQGLDRVVAGDLYRMRGYTWFDVAKYSNARRNVTEGIKRVGRSRGQEAKEVLAKLEAFRAGIEITVGNNERALEAADKAAKLARSTDDVRTLARAYDVMDRANFMLGTDAPRKGEEAIRLLEEGGHLWDTERIMNNQGALAYFEGKWDEAATWYHKSIEAAERSGHVGESGAANTRINLAELLISQRRYDEAIPLVEESKRVMTAAGALHALPFVRLQEARATLGKGNADQAVEILSEIFDALIESGDTYEAPETAVHLAEALVESGREKEAEEKLDVLELRASDDAERVTGGILRIRGLARASQNKLDEAGELLERALNHAIEDGDLFGEALSRAALAELAVRGGSTQDAASLERTNEIHGILGIVA